jgi:F420H(2)-dependent quinone reductase
MSKRRWIRNSRLIALLLKHFARVHIWVYRRTKSSEPRTTATLYLRPGDRVILPASFGGRQDNPLWYQNLKENPEVQVQIRAQRLHLLARDATDAERDRYWPPLMRMYRITTSTARPRTGRFR